MGNSFGTLWIGVEKDIDAVRDAFTKLDCLMGGTVEVRTCELNVQTSPRDAGSECQTRYTLRCQPLLTISEIQLNIAHCDSIASKCCNGALHPESRSHHPHHAAGLQAKAKCRN